MRFSCVFLISFVFSLALPTFWGSFNNANAADQKLRTLENTWKRTGFHSDFEAFVRKLLVLGKTKQAFDALYEYAETYYQKNKLPVFSNDLGFQIRTSELFAPKPALELVLSRKDLQEEYLRRVDLELTKPLSQNTKYPKAYLWLHLLPPGYTAKEASKLRFSRDSKVNYAVCFEEPNLFSCFGLTHHPLARQKEPGTRTEIYQKVTIKKEKEILSFIDSGDLIDPDLSLIEKLKPFLRPITAELFDDLKQVVYETMSFHQMAIEVEKHFKQFRFSVDAFSVLKRMKTQVADLPFHQRLPLLRSLYHLLEKSWFNFDLKTRNWKAPSQQEYFGITAETLLDALRRDSRLKEQEPSGPVLPNPFAAVVEEIEENCKNHLKKRPHEK